MGEPIHSNQANLRQAQDQAQPASTSAGVVVWKTWKQVRKETVQVLDLRHR